MPPKKELTKERIMDAAFAYVRENGFEALTARSITQYLHCSTQPVYSVFGNIDGLKKSVYEKAADQALSYMTAARGEENPPALNMAIGFLLFAKNEKHLFRTLYLSGYKTYDPKHELFLGEELFHSYTRFSSRLQSAPEPVIQTLFLKLSIYLIGIGTMLNANTLELNIEEATEMVREMYEMLLTQAGISRPANQTKEQRGQS